MSRSRTQYQNGKRGYRLLLLTSATAAGALLLGAPLLAQSMDLRTAEATPDPITTQSALEQIAAQPVYQPISEGALPADPQFSSDRTARSPSIFDNDQANQGPFSDPLPPPATPSSQRRNAATGVQSSGNPVLPSGGRALRDTGSTIGNAVDTGETTGTVDALPAQAQARLDAGDLIEGDGNVRSGPIEGRRRTYEETPYSAVGLRAGNFLVFPTIEQGLVATSNANSSNNGKSAVISETTLRASISSDWSRHAAALSGYGTYRKSIEGQNVETFWGGLDGALRFDLADDYTLDITGTYQITPESATSPVVIEGTLDEPIRQTFEGSAGLSKTFGQLQLTGTGRVEREIYGDADLSTGGTVSQKDRNSTLAAFVLRTGWEVSPALTPFVEGEVGRRIYDNEIDAAGYERSALRTGIRAGLEFDITEKLTGEFSGGVVSEDFDDDRLKRLSAATFAADLRWSPMRGTTVEFNGDTTVEGTTTPGDSGSVLYSAAISATRELRANLTGTVSAGLGWRDFRDIDGKDLLWNAETSLTYWLNRYAGLTTRARYEQVRSDRPFRDSETASIYLGLKLQR